ncbi:hypothetical protein [Siminovitchia fordii]|uniref:Uncharacterized protein n=1 Tax=Siminovitchia fordii TaxID=254759 RepID=A0ABQ4K7J2_9BACI|nr:hypothetical protein [Siminovitchia fordii]GIN21167.1 hypothetical protein J1TS3_23010 [Siminovitchia fordii]
MEWSLEDIEKASQINSSFYIPTLKERKSQKKGDLVRLHFLVTNHSEDSPVLKECGLK